MTNYMHNRKQTENKLSRIAYTRHIKWKYVTFFYHFEIFIWLCGVAVFNGCTIIPTRRLGSRLLYSTMFFLWPSLIL